MKKTMIAICICVLAFTVAGCRDITADLHDTYVITFHHGTINPATDIADPPLLLQTDIRGRLSRIPSPIRGVPGFTFGGWFIVGGNEQVNLQTIFHRDTDVYARWIPPPRTPGPLEQALLDLRGTTLPNITISLTAEQVGVENIMPQYLYFGGHEIDITLNGNGHNLRLANVGAMFTVGNGVTLRLQNVMIEGFVEAIGGRSLHNTESLILVKDGGKLYIENGATIARNWNRNTVTRRGGGITVLVGGELTMNGGLIDENRAGVSGAGGFLGFGGGVFVDGGKFTMNGGVIENNLAFIGIGGGVYVNRAGLFVKTGGEIRNNAANRGGGVGVGGRRYKPRGDCGIPPEDCIFCMADNSSRYIVHFSVFEMRDNGMIFDNFGVEGGGVDVHNLSRFYMHGGAIDYNQAIIGAGIFNFGAHVNIDGGTISRGMASFIGGGIYNFGYLNLHAGSSIINNNVDLMGGGVFNDVLGSFTMYAGTIQNNSVGNFANSFGGGVFNAGGFMMHGGTIQDNGTAAGDSGAISTGFWASGNHRNRHMGVFVITGGLVNGGLRVSNYQFGVGGGGGAFRGLEGFFMDRLRPPGTPGVDFFEGLTDCPANRQQIFFVPQPILPTHPWRGASVGWPIMGHTVLDEYDLLRVHIGSITDCSHLLCVSLSGPAHLILTADEPWGWPSTPAWGRGRPAARLTSQSAVNMTTPPTPLPLVLPPGEPSPALAPHGVTPPTPPSAQQVVGTSFIAPSHSNLSSSMYFSIFDQHGNINPEFAGISSSVLDRLRSFFGDDLLAARHSMDSVMNPWPLGGR